MKLHVGCGNNLKPGYINIDRIKIYETRDKYIQMDVFDLDRFFAKGSVSEIYTEYLLEHLSHEEIPLVMFKFANVLKTGGTMMHLIPDIFTVLNNLHTKKKLKEWNTLFLLNLAIFGAPPIANETQHKSIWSEEIARLYIEGEKFFKITNIWYGEGLGGEGIRIEAVRL
jgi:hypothetical protein